jgi:predicted amidohydrolase
MSFRIAIVQPLSHRPGADEANLADALRHIEAAARDGAHFVVFPESYPGPWTMPSGFDPCGAMAQAAQRHGVHVVYGTLEPTGGAPRQAYNLVVMAYPDGRPQARYRRTHPTGSWIYTGGAYWDFDYAAGDEYPVFDTVHGKVGLAMCSEVYMPEVCRALALRGAELIFMPAGIDKRRLWESWRSLIWARAIENLAVVVTTQNLFDPAERGLAMVAGPEQILFESSAPGLFLVDVDLARARELRGARDEPASSLTQAAKAGVLSQWQRPELYGRFFPAPQTPGAAASGAAPGPAAGSAPRSRYRRVVTGHDGQGRSILVADAPEPRTVRLDKAGGLMLTELWETRGTPEDIGGRHDAARNFPGIEPMPAGTVFRVIEYPPDRERLKHIAPETFYASMGAAHDSTGGGRHPGMHLNQSVDYVIILEGEIVAIMDEGETLLRAGDILIQRGTNHAWSNRTDKPCVIAFVLVWAPEPAPGSGAAVKPG